MRWLAPFAAAVAFLVAARCPASTSSCPPPCSSPEVVVVGHWIAARGKLGEDDVFLAETVEILPPEEDGALIGVVTGQPGALRLLGRALVPTAETKWRRVDPARVSGVRVKAEGAMDPEGRFVVRKVSLRGEGRERVVGRVETVRRGAGGIVASVLGIRVRLPAFVLHEGRLADIPLGAPRPPDAGADEDDLFGQGLRLAEGLWLRGQVELETTAEDEFDLDRGDAEDRTDLAASARLRFEWQPRGRAGAVLEIRRSHLVRSDQGDGTLSRDDAKLGQTYLLLRDVGGQGLDLQLGRQDFDDSREWVYDQNLDAARLFLRRGGYLLELSVSTSLDGRRDDRETTNTIARIGRRFGDSSWAAYVVRREVGGESAEQRNHFGLSVAGPWLPRVEGWLELAGVSGSRRDDRDLQGWGFDVGATWSPRALEPLTMTLGAAFGSGDDGSPGRDRTFRQTGLQDNNARFAGVTSFRYYGELLDPELANLRILTAGLGCRVARGTSIDVVWHDYRQATPVGFLVDAELDRHPDGVHAGLGSEVDLIFGSRRVRWLDVEVVAGWFQPGRAFPDADPARLGRVQLRWRF